MSNPTYEEKQKLDLILWFSDENWGTIDFDDIAEVLKEFAGRLDNEMVASRLSNDESQYYHDLLDKLSEEDGGIDGFHKDTKVILQPPSTDKEFTYYIAGPMTGYRDHNFPAFNDAQDQLEEWGYSVFNPAQNFSGVTDLPWDTYLRADIRALSRCRKIYLLNGWRKSKGACFEYLIAKMLGLGIAKEGGTRSSSIPILDENSRIALCGYSRVGKDEVGKWFIERGYNRTAIGDIIKSQVDPIVQAHLGHSAFTEDDEKKENIREFLVAWGYSNYDNILDEYFDSLSGRVVNTRLYRFKEAERWVEEGGKIVLVERPGFDEREPKAKEELDQIKDAGLISETIVNNGTISDLHDELTRKFPEVAEQKEAEA